MTDVLYSLIDADGERVYIGVTNSPAVRFAHHKATRPAMWGKVAQIELERYDDRDDALNAERARIEFWQPEFNIDHTERATALRRSRAAKRRRGPCLSSQLADQLLPGGLSSFIATRRERGLSWHSIAFEFSTETGVVVPGETIRRWSEDTEAAA